MRDRPQIRPGMVRGEWQHKTALGHLQCDLCPRHCILKEDVMGGLGSSITWGSMRGDEERVLRAGGPPPFIAGERGYCYIRQVFKGEIVLTTYGCISGLCVDPIEKKPLNHFYPGTRVLSFGTVGCNLGCRFCQNWQLSKARETVRLTDFVAPEAIVNEALKTHCQSIAFTYNEPIIFAEYAIDTAECAHEQGLKTVAVTAGYISDQAREAFFAPMDAANVDLKAFNEDFYRHHCSAQLGPVLDTLIYLRHETEVWLEITTLLIPGLNDSDQELDALCGWIVQNLGEDVPLHFTAFHPDFKLLDVPPTSIETLQRARKRARHAGLRHVYTGNLYDPEGQGTYCSHCGQLLIEREGYCLGRIQVLEGRCVYCAHPLMGRF